MKDIGTHITSPGDGFDQVKAGLIRKRGELASAIQALQQETAQKVADLRAIETALRIFDPAMDLQGLPASRIPPAYASFRGEMARFFLGQLRHSGSEGHSTKELAVALMIDRCMDTDDARAQRLIQRRTSHSMLNLRRRGFVRSEKDGPSGMLRWWLVDMGPLEGGWRNGSD